MTSTAPMIDAARSLEKGASDLVEMARALRRDALRMAEDVRVVSRRLEEFDPTRALACSRQFALIALDPRAAV
ncbi:hypothetical protein ACM64Y_05990 [Novispirillum sp. DQ9]|uniref:hypothetical protein n=1 Tax=Novispirillum sp. DQ9 TaxID=3398612 RepID=UPI003C7BBD3A